MKDEIHVELKGFSVVPKLAKVWDVLVRGGHHFDVYSVGNADRRLAEDPLPRLAACTKKKSFWRVALGSPEGTTFLLHHNEVSLCFDWCGRDVDTWLTWLDALLSLAPVESGKVWRRDFETFNVYRHGPHAGWLFICGGAMRTRLERAGVTNFLARRKGGFQRTIKKTLVTGLAASPLDRVAGDRETLTEAGDGLLIDVAERESKVELLAVEREVFRRVLGPLGFKEVAGATRRELCFSKGKVSVVCSLDLGIKAASLSVSARLQGSSPQSYWLWALGNGPLRKAKVILEKALALYLSKEERFLKYPKRFR